MTCHKPKCNLAPVFCVWGDGEYLRYCGNHYTEDFPNPPKVKNMCPLCNTPGVLKDHYIRGKKTKACRDCYEAYERERRG
jgi:hypothetical protein